MPGGHASHKGKSIKPNTNAEAKLDTAADLTVDPEEIISEGPDAHRAEEAPKNEQATERPQEQNSL